MVKEIQSLKNTISHLMCRKSEKECADLEMDVLQISTTYDLQQFNENLKEVEYFKKSLSKFGLVGGKDSAETTRKILSLMISNDLAVKLNWSGRNNKLGMGTLQNIIRLIHGAVRRNPLTKEAKNVEINSVTKNWLRNASDRGGGRSRRGRTDKIKNVTGYVSNFNIQDQRYFCKVCNKSYKHRRHLSSHIKYECMKQPMFECTYCNKKFYQRYTLNAHYRQVHGLQHT